MTNILTEQRGNFLSLKYEVSFCNLRALLNMRDIGQSRNSMKNYAVALIISPNSDILTKNFVFTPEISLSDYIRIRKTSSDMMQLAKKIVPIHMITRLLRQINFRDMLRRRRENAISRQMIFITTKVKARCISPILLICKFHSSNYTIQDSFLYEPNKAQ